MFTKLPFKLAIKQAHPVSDGGDPEKPASALARKAGGPKVGMHFSAAAHGVPAGCE
jgi:hypothetical protein